MQHEHELSHEANHSHHHTPTSLWGWIAAIFHLDGHNHEDHPTSAVDPINSNQEAVRTVWLALFALGLTTILQILIVAFSGSVALLADTIHNVGDTLNSIPLLVAFYLARRAATRRYTYGFGRAEDIAGILIIVSIAVSAVLVFWESLQKLFNPQPMQNIGWVAAAAVIGFLGNEAVAVLQIRTGRKIGSDAMIADGLHARIDGLTSLAVLVAVAGTLLGIPLIDPLIGLLIGVTILFITKDATVRIWYRLMDAVNPTLVNQIEHYAGEVQGVEHVDKLRVHWVGHQLFAELTITVEAHLSVVEATEIVNYIATSLQSVIPQLAEINVQVHPNGETGEQKSVNSNKEGFSALSILPPRYQLNTTVSAAPMGAAGLIYDSDGKVAWDQIWQGSATLP